MNAPFFHVAMTAPGRQRGFRITVAAHVLYTAAFALPIMFAAPHLQPQALLGQALLIAGIIEGATLIGWRLTQLPKSRSLEFLLASPLQPSRIFLAEALVGVARLALVGLSGLPMLVFLLAQGRLSPPDLVVLLPLPFMVGVTTGLILTTWSYEPVPIRRFGELLFLVLLLIYLTLGVLLGEKLGLWIAWLAGPGQSHQAVATIRWLVSYSPFDVVQQWFSHPTAYRDFEALTDGRELIGPLLLVIAAFVGLLAVRSALRLHGHFHDRHYFPVSSHRPAELDRIGDAPLSWWAVKRVMEYAGRSNLYLAGGFGAVYAVYVVAGPAWPSWLGRSTLSLFDSAFAGIPGVTTGLVVLAAVPAAFQYGLWDSSAQDRSARMELLLLTDLNGRDYWRAAAAAAWVRGRGYFAVALLLWTAGLLANQPALMELYVSWGWLAAVPTPLPPPKVTLEQILAAASAGVILWGLSFSMGFGAFSRGLQANGLGSLLTLAIPLTVYLLLQSDWVVQASLLPPGSVYLATARPLTWWWAIGPLLAGISALMISRWAIMRCEGDLRRWYDRNHAAHSME